MRLKTITLSMLLLSAASTPAQSFKVIVTSPVGVSTSATPFGAPVNASIYTPSSVSGNYTPAWGAFAKVYDTSWPANGTSALGNTNCVELQNYTSPLHEITFDYGSVVSIKNIYVSALSFVSGVGDNSFAVSFSTDGTAYIASKTFTMPHGSSNKTFFKNFILTAPVGARYVRLSANFSYNNAASFCEFAVGP